MRFEGKTVVVTGGANGIGQSVCEILSSRGAAVSIIDQNESSGVEVCRKIVEAGGKATFTSLDVSSFTSVEAAIKKTHADFGSVDALVVSAGIQRYGTALTTTEDQWNEVLAVNLKGAWNAARAVIPFMQQTGAGSIVNVSSVQALATQPNVLAYTISKHALIGLTRSLAIDFAKNNIRVNAVCPGSVDTPMLRWAVSLDKNPEAVIDACNRMHPLGRIARPDEIAEVITFLLHESSSFVSGAVWTVDGGLMAQLGGAPGAD